ncbi:hypothetical protein MUN89_03210 [Halobacillus salinarum]|uniref:RNA polymerase sigma factor 54 core-binding domain-containing protein n=1 Tax=Halobacillus salinarum TaxID=2932257 RepID=A0ABY4ELD6_9BACI|nr:hypothetical protein [Halobacillus salinarum]UOQ44974.1 hypothetical protein MUN89_03210 [Halobacillus salinarum]
MKLEQTQTTKLYMTKELRQNIELLTYTYADLEQFIEEKTLENPLLEFKSIANKEDYTSYLPKQTFDWRTDIHEQLGWLDISRHQKQVLAVLVESLSERGFLEETDQQLADVFSIEVEEVQNSRRQLMMLEPEGLGSRGGSTFSPFKYISISLRTSFFTK